MAENAEKNDKEITTCDRDWDLLGLNDPDGKSNVKKKV